jgi:hypothetical protein
MGYGEDPSVQLRTACLCGPACAYTQAGTQTGLCAVDVFAVSQDGSFVNKLRII